MTNEQNFLKIQNDLKDKLDLTDSPILSELHTVAGVDLAYWKDADGTECAVCCIVVIDYQTHEVLEKQQYSGRIEVEYVPGFLAFRELPLVRKTVALLQIKPDLYVFDGNGYLHPRHMGIASQASFDLGAPTFGIAKTYFRVSEDAAYAEPEDAPGSFTDITAGEEVYGRALRTHKGVKPVFVSVGNHISLDTACRIAMSFVTKESHIPLPTRLADLETHTARKGILGA
jgi:deoxyribonuclease V